MAQGFGARKKLRTNTHRGEFSASYCLCSTPLGVVVSAGAIICIAPRTPSPPSTYKTPFLAWFCPHEARQKKQQQRWQQ